MFRFARSFSCRFVAALSSRRSEKKSGATKHAVSASLARTSAASSGDTLQTMSSTATVKSTDVASFIAANVSPVDRDLSSELSGPTEKTLRLWNACQEALRLEYDRGGCLGVDVSRACGIASHPPGYIVTERTGDDDVVVGIQTEKPLVRGVKPLGGARLTRRACSERGAGDRLDAVDALLAPFDPESPAHVRRTHNDCVFDLYDAEMRAARSNHIVTGLPDAYGRGRVVGDYRRVALRGVDALVE